MNPKRLISVNGQTSSIRKKIDFEKSVDPHFPDVMVMNTIQVLFRNDQSIVRDYTFNVGDPDEAPDDLTFLLVEGSEQDVNRVMTKLNLSDAGYIRHDEGDSEEIDLPDDILSEIEGIGEESIERHIVHSREAILSVCDRIPEEKRLNPEITSIADMLREGSPVIYRAEDSVIAAMIQGKIRPVIGLGSSVIGGENGINLAENWDDTFLEPRIFFRAFLVDQDDDGDFRVTDTISDNTMVLIENDILGYLIEDMVLGTAWILGNGKLGTDQEIGSEIRQFISYSDISVIGISPTGIFEFSKASVINNKDRIRDFEFDTEAISPVRGIRTFDTPTRMISGFANEESSRDLFVGACESVE